MDDCPLESLDPANDLVHVVFLSFEAEVARPANLDHSPDAQLGAPGGKISALEIGDEVF